MSTSCSDDYGYEEVEWLDRDALARRSAPDVYFGGRRDAGAGHLDPLKFAQGLARAAAKAGARIFTKGRERRSVSRHSGSKRSAARSPPTSSSSPATATSTASTTTVEARVMPIDNYILATEPIGAGATGRADPRRRSRLRHALRRLLLPPERRRPAGLRRRRDLFAATRRARHRRVCAPTSCADLSAARRHAGRLRLGRDAGDHAATACPSSAACGRGSMRRPDIRGQGVALAPFAGKILADAIGGDPAALDALRRPPGAGLPRRHASALPGAGRRDDLVRAARPALIARFQ